MASLIDDDVWPPRWPHPSAGHGRPLTILVVVDAVDEATESTVAYARALDPERLLGIHFRRSSTTADAVRRRWVPTHPTIPLVALDPVDDSVSRALSVVVNSELPSREHPVIVMVPQPRRGPTVAPRQARTNDLVAAFAGIDDVFVIAVSNSFEPE